MNKNYWEFMHAVAGVPYEKPMSRFVATEAEKKWALEEKAKHDGKPTIMGLDPITGEPKRTVGQAYQKPESAQPAFDPSQIDSAARAVTEGRMSPAQAAQAFGGFGGNASAFKREMNLRVLQMKPDFNFQEAESSYKFGSSAATQGTVRYIDNIRNTIPAMQKLVDKMDLGGIRLVNRASLAAQKQFGEGDVAAYELMQTLVSDELAKILQGGGTGSQTSDAKIQQALGLMQHDMSPAQWRAVLSTANEMLDIRSKALKSGTFMDKSGSQGQQAPAAGTSVRVQGKDGKTYEFPDQASADAFKKAGG